MADIICHGTPSPELFQMHLAYVGGQRKSAVVAYEHRPKSQGWGHFERFTLKNGKTEQGTPLANTWRELFYDNRMLRPSCYRCPHTSLKRESDVTIADFWGIENSSRPEVKDALGVSLVLASSERGERVISELQQRGLIEAWPMTAAEALPGNPMLERPSTYEGDHGEPWRALYRDGYARMVREMGYRRSGASDLSHRVASKAKRVVKRMLERR